MAFNILVGDEVLDYLEKLPEKGEKIIKDNLRKLKGSPFPGKDPGDKKRLTLRGEKLNRLYIGRIYTAFYIIEDNNVEIIDLMTTRSTDDSDVPPRLKRVGFYASTTG